MSLFGNILNKLGIGPAAAPAAPPRQVPHASTTPHTPARPSPQPMSTAPTVVVPKYVVDVVAKLDTLVAMDKQKLDWRHSIVDLLKTLSLDSSFAARKAMAVELGCPAEKMADSAQMNMWLHKAVMQKLRENGGNIPPELLD